MEAKSTDKKTFQLTENGLLLGELLYENMFFLKAEIKLANLEHYEINPVGFFGTSISITKEGTEIANLKMNWRGQIVITYQDEEEFVLKAKGMLQDNYILENKHQEKLIEFDPTFNWKNFDYKFSIIYD